MPKILCPTCDAYMSGPACIICGWKAPRIKPAPDPEVKLQRPLDPHRKSPEEVRALVSSITNSLSMTVSQKMGDCPTCWRVGCLRQSRINSHEWYFICLSCGTKTMQDYRTPEEAARAWSAGEVKVSSLPWSIPPALDPRVQAHAEVFKSKGVEELEAIRRAQDVVADRDHGGTCGVCSGGVPSPVLTAAAAGSSPPRLPG